MAAAASAPGRGERAGARHHLGARRAVAAASPAARRSRRRAPAGAAAVRGAEIVGLRPHAAAARPPPPASRNDSVALTSQERDAFKEIARALGVNVRGPPAVAKPGRDGRRTAVARAAGRRRSRRADRHLPIAALVTRDGEALFANKTLLDLTGFSISKIFAPATACKAIFRGRDAAGARAGRRGRRRSAGRRRRPHSDRRRAGAAPIWRGAPAELVAMRRSREADHQAELRALERETAMHAARARDLAAALEAARDGMVRLDRDGRILGMNKGAEALFGCDQKEAAGDSVLTLFAPGSHAAPRPRWSGWRAARPARSRRSKRSRARRRRRVPGAARFRPARQCSPSPISSCC